MKKYMLYVFMLFYFCGLFANERTLHKVPKEYLGTYIPVDYELLLKKYKSHVKALMEIAPTHYDVLILDKSVCHSTILFADGYAVLAKNFTNWHFYTEETEKYIIDENGYKYRRISEVLSEREVRNYVLKTIFADFSDKNIEIIGDAVKIQGQIYEIKMEAYISQKETSLFLLSRENGKLYFVITKTDGFMIVEAERNPDDIWAYDPTDNVIYSYQMF